SEFVFHDSFEVEHAVGEALLAQQGACWMLAGYASGYASVFMGKEILVREVECRACGDRQCRAVARPAEDWPDADRDRKSLHLSAGQKRESASGRASQRRVTRRAKSASQGATG